MSQHDSDLPDGALEAAAGGQGLEQVREILFGQQNRTLDQRLQQVEGRIDEALAALRRETAERFADLETLIKNDVTGLIDKLRTQGQERSELFQQVKGDLETLIQNTATRFQDLESRFRHDFVDRDSLGSALGDVALRLAKEPVATPKHAEGAEEVLDDLLAGTP